MLYGYGARCAFCYVASALRVCKELRVQHYTGQMPCPQCTWPMTAHAYVHAFETPCGRAWKAMEGHGRPRKATKGQSMEAVEGQGRPWKAMEAHWEI